MNKIQEKALLEYPAIPITGTSNGDYHCELRRMNVHRRKAYETGYLQAKADFLEKAKVWIDNNCAAACKADAVFTDFKRFLDE